MKYLKTYDKLNEQVEEDKMFLDLSYFDDNEYWSMEDLDREELMCSSYQIEEDDFYRIYRLNKHWPSDMAGKFILVYIDTSVVDGPTIRNYSDEIDPEQNSDIYIDAVKNVVKKMQSYEIQKEFLEEHPDRATDLKPFGFHERIKKEYPALVRGSEWGFFDLEK